MAGAATIRVNPAMGGHRGLSLVDPCPLASLGEGEQAAFDMSHCRHDTNGDTNQ
jgi:hypothetical protein